MLERSINKTNVIWSLESAEMATSQVTEIIDSDVDAVRVLGRCAELSGLMTQVRAIKAQVAGRGRQTPIIVDLSKQVRCRLRVDEPQDLQFDDVLSFSRYEPDQGGMGFDCGDWLGFFKMGAVCFLGRGTISFEPIEVSDSTVKVKVIHGGTISADMEVHCPETEVSARFEDLREAELDLWLQEGVDCIITPGSFDATDLQKLKKLLRSKTKSPPWLLLKINSEQSYQTLSEVLPHIRGVMVARNEIAMHLDPARVPMLTKEVIQLCNDHGKCVLVASDILASMRHNVTPTRAEVSDIANAALDGVDGVVLSEELAHGPYTVRGLALAKRAIYDTERQLDQMNLNWVKKNPAINHTLAAVTYSAYKTAMRLQAKAIVCLTYEGNTALLLACFRTDIPIVAVTLSPEVLRRLSLIRGVYGLLLDDAPDIEHVLPLVNQKITRDTWLNAGDRIVFVSVSLSSIGEKASNLFTVQTLS